MAQLIVHGRVALQTVTALANLLRPPLPQDFPQNPFPVDVQIAEAQGSDGWTDQRLERLAEMSVSDGGAGLYCWESVLVAGAGAWLGWARAPHSPPGDGRRLPSGAAAAILDPKPRQPAANPRPARPLGREIF